MARMIRAVAGAVLGLGLAAAPLPVVGPWWAEAQTAPQPAMPGGSRLDEIAKRGVLRVALSGDYRPFSIRTGEVHGTEGMEGLDVDMAAALAKSLGVRLELVQFGWPTLMQDLAADRFDIAMGGITVTLARQKVAFFSTPVMRGGKTPIARCENKEKYQTLADIDRPEVKVIVNPGGTNESFDRANLKQAQIVMFPDNARIFDQLASGGADLMITDSVEALLQQKLLKELCAIHPDQPFTTSDLAYLLPRDIVWQQYVDQWLHIMDQTGDRKQLLAKWLD